MVHLQGTLQGCDGSPTLSTSPEHVPIPMFGNSATELASGLVPNVPSPSPSPDMNLLGADSLKPCYLTPNNELWMDVQHDLELTLGADSLKPCYLTPNNELWTDVQHDMELTLGADSLKPCYLTPNNELWTDVRHDLELTIVASFEMLGLRSPSTKPPSLAASSSSAQFEAGAFKRLSRERPPRQAFGNIRKQRSCTSFIFCISLHEAKAFELVAKLIGKRGMNMKQISSECNSNLRVRGKGSAYMEVQGPNGKAEADIPLQLVVSSPDMENLENARGKVLPLLNHLAMRYNAFCRKRGRQSPACFFMEICYNKEPTSNDAS